MSAPAVRAMFREWVDEPRTAWLTDAQVARWLGFAYEQFRTKVSDVDRSVFLEGVQLVLTAGQIEYDLAAAASAVRIMGNPAGGLTGPRLRRAYDVFLSDANGRPSYFLNHTRNLRQLGGFQRLGPSQQNNGRPNWWLQGAAVAFDPAPGAGTYVLNYLPEQGVDWTSASADVVDDLVAWHDVVALLAARSYLARDGVENRALENLVAQRVSEFDNWLAAGRNVDANDGVLDEYP